MSHSPTNIEKARINLVINNPFFGALALRMRLVKSEQVTTFGVYKTTIYYNEKFAESLTITEVYTVLAHEIMHIALLHSMRINSRQHQLWNIAADFAINDMLQSSQFKLPKDALLSPKYSNMSAEAIYEKLLSDAKQQPSSGNKKASDLSTGEIMSKPAKDDPDKDAADKPMGESNEQDAEAAIKEAVSSAATAARSQGKSPTFIDRLVGELSKPKINWKSLLISFLSKVKHSDKSWKRPHRAFYSAGVYLPSQKIDYTGEVVVAIDTSGSIGDKELCLFMSEVNGILATLKPSKLHVVYCDAKVQHVDTVLPTDRLPIKPKGGGGTDFTPVFDYIKDNNIAVDALVYYTDGYGSFPRQAPSYPVLWAIFDTDIDNIDTPFGYKVSLPTLAN